jgi:hypothetical protein
MWVKGTLLHFIIDSGSQKNLISPEVIKWLALPTKPSSHGSAKEVSSLSY